MDGRSNLLLLLFCLFSLALLSMSEEDMTKVTHPFQVVPMHYYMQVDFKIQSGEGIHHLKGQTISLWMGHPWSDKLPDQRLAEIDFVEGDVEPKILLQCEQMLGFLNFRKALYLTKSKTGSKIASSAKCLELGYYDSDTQLKGTMNLNVDDPRWTYCRKASESILDEVVCRDTQNEI